MSETAEPEDLAPQRITDSTLDAVSKLDQLSFLRIRDRRPDQSPGQPPLFTAGGLEHLSKLNRLQELYLDCTVSDEGLKHLDQLNSLKTLSVYPTSQMTLRGMHDLLQSTPNQHSPGLIIKLGGRWSSSRLMRTSISLTRRQHGDSGADEEFTVTDEDLKDLKGLWSMRLTGTSVTTHGLKYLADGTGLNDLRIEPLEIVDGGFESIADLESLKSLYFKPAVRSSVPLSQLLTVLAENPALRITVMPSAEKANSAGATYRERRLNTNCTLSMNHVFLPEFLNVTDEDLRLIGRLRGLKSIDVISSHITDVGVRSLAGVDGLEKLSLGGAVISDEGLDSLQELDGLRELTLYLGPSEVTRKRVDRLKLQLRDCRIQIRWQRKQ